MNMSSTTKLLKKEHFERMYRYLKYVFASKPAESLVRDTNQSGTVEVRLFFFFYNVPVGNLSNKYYFPNV